MFKNMKIVLWAEFKRSIIIYCLFLTTYDSSHPLPSPIMMLIDHIRHISPLLAVYTSFLGLEPKEKFFALAHPINLGYFQIHPWQIYVFAWKVKVDVLQFLSKIKNLEVRSGKLGGGAVESREDVWIIEISIVKTSNTVFQLTLLHSKLVILFMMK